MTIADEIERLENMRREGVLSEEEFKLAKARAIQESSPQFTSTGRSVPVSSHDGLIQGMQPDTWCMLMHLSQLLTFSGLGVLVPIVMWAMSKDESAQADEHGVMIMNWLISGLIYGLVFGVLCFVLIGFPLLFGLAIAMVVFPIVGAIKAKDGVLWDYPLTIEFLQPTCYSTAMKD